METRNSTHKNLRDLTLLVIDCQATGPSPRSAHLLEIGWLKARIPTFSDSSEIAKHAQAFLVRLPGNKSVPRRVSEITGITNEDVRQGRRRDYIWTSLYKTASEISGANGMNGCPAVAHFARYEEPFIRDLYDRFSRGGVFPFQMICTHEIMRRLMPGLPRKSLRAVAGYFGHSVPKPRRSLSHVVATAHIWSHLIPILEERLGIYTYRELVEWLADPPDKSRPSKSLREYPMNPTCLENLPDSPGIYMMYRSNMDLLYVGKAKSIKRRVASYFRRKGAHSESVLEMLSQARSLTYSLTPTAVHAALLETDIIKELSPGYNVALQKTSLAPIFFTQDFSDFSTSPGNTYLQGPFPSNSFGNALFQLLQTGSQRPFKPSPLEMSNILCIPREFVPSQKVFKQGIQELMNDYHLPAPPAWNLSMIRRLGTILWREHLQERELNRNFKAAEDRHEPSPEMEKEGPASRGMNPEGVKNALKFIIRNVCHQMRRARWLSRISESRLVWDTAEGNGSENNILAFSGGRIQYTSRLSPSSIGEVLKTPSQSRTHEERLQQFDNIIYDRMRVLSTEIKRILSEKRQVSLWFDSRPELTKEQLQRMLPWV